MPLPPTSGAATCTTICNLPWAVRRRWGGVGYLSLATLLAACAPLSNSREVI